jgi:2-(1,2-epoxy-1,2-dihydrophenyl)acetyl-CoA isomerase
MSWEHVLLDVSENIATITLNRPERMNAFGGKMRQEIVEVLESVAVDKDIRVVVITGAGKAFCTGGDVGEFAAGTTKCPCTID